MLAIAPQVRNLSVGGPAGGMPTFPTPELITHESEISRASIQGRYMSYESSCGVSGLGRWACPRSLAAFNHIQPDGLNAPFDLVG